ncbi:WXG100 family type VII secretion target [Microbacterium sp.]|uniref:WXG100 family type VII secretion target n=1 Tax=Microbacterium sp. TaxID=51671 RepID=UPI003F96CFCB
MPDVISAEEGALKAGAQAVNVTKTGIEREVRKVRGEIEQLRSIWTGPASVSFTALMARWDDQTNRLNGVLVTLEDALTGTERDQNAGEESHKQIISGLGSMMA